MSATTSYTEQLLPVIYRMLRAIGHHYPDARWHYAPPKDEHDCALLTIYVDVPNSWQVHELTRQELDETDSELPSLVIVVEPLKALSYTSAETFPV